MESDLNGAKSGAEFNKTADICGGNGFLGNSARVIGLGEVAACLTGAQREKFVSGFDMKGFAKIFEDESMMTTAETFLACGLNVSLAARRLYMHRNTLIYRLNALKRKTGLDLRNFDMAVTFEMLHKMYLIK
ncbi:MAG: helix-turn-helix domain-containing protein [Clostridia bacterium]|nr:helix-turn-helix domain-containing protein [Clostridia bacterium]MDE7215074.1 helix-turn-helix domain-containing protein [Clostridia bacterium]